MVFNSLAYAAFLPLAVVLCFLAPARRRWAVLLALSCLFYAWADPRLLLLLGADVAVGYGAGRALGALRRPAARRGVLAAGAAWLLGGLFLFKYLGFAARTLAGLLGLAGLAWRPPAFSLVLPLGISFYTFQSLGYLIDVYRGTLPPERHPGYYALFVCFFPQLVSGPIGRGGDLLPQLHAEHAPDPARFTAGLQRILAGLFKKVVIADFLAGYVDSVFDSLTNQGGLTLILAGVLYSFQLYCDFSGYTDMAAGSAQLFGIRLAENFQSPYFSRSIKEFWRRWHISLSRWFSEYLYIPLGGSRCSAPRHLANLLLTFLASGLWHGAAWNFVLWGLYHGLWLCLETFTLPRVEALQARLPAPAGRLLAAGRTLTTFAAATAGWMIFRVNSLADLGYFAANITRGLNPLRLMAYAGAMGFTPATLALAALLIGLLLAWDGCALRRGDPFAVLGRAGRWPRRAVYYLLALAVLAAACSRPFGATADFIYFQF